MNGMGLAKNTKIEKRSTSASLRVHWSGCHYIDVTTFALHAPASLSPSMESCRDAIGGEGPTITHLASLYDSAYVE